MRNYIGGWLIVLLLTGRVQAGPAPASFDGNTPALGSLHAGGAPDKTARHAAPPSSKHAAAEVPAAEVDEPPGLMLVLLGTGILILWMRRWPPTR